MDKYTARILEWANEDEQTKRDFETFFKLGTAVLHGNLDSVALAMESYAWMLAQMGKTPFGVGVVNNADWGRVVIEFGNSAVRS